MLTNLLDLWNIGSIRKRPDYSKEEHPNNEEVKKYEESRNPNPNSKNFPGINLTRRRKKRSALCATSIQK